MTYYADHEQKVVDHPAEHVDSRAMIVAVWALLVVGAILNIGISFADLGGTAIYIHMMISLVQLCLVAYFWMHLQRSDSLTWLTALSAFFFMIILFALPLTDYLTRHRGGL
ncbi:MAG TPA: cytochrome C oxidase subunit IV family protein [Gemmataceae bacterium]|nr:cytochrome C oxidase subunit IV family protein [Gemmataceae bacterium]